MLNSRPWCFNKIMEKIRLLCILIIVGVESLNAKDIPCPKNTSRFRAFPFESVEKRSFYYECLKNDNVAALKTCKRGQTYNSEYGECVVDDKISDNEDFSRAKRNVDEGPNQARTNNANSIALVNQPSLGRTIRLGALYYGSTDRVAVEENLWNEETLKNAYVANAPSSDYDVKISEKNLDRMSNFGLQASLGLSFMGGLINVKGHAKYLTDRKRSTSSVSFALIYNSQTSTESLTPEIIKNIDYANICNNNVGDPSGPTHVISSITRGFNAVFNFRHEKSSDYAQTNVEGSLRAVIDSIPSLKIDAEVKLKLSETETITGDDIKCSFFGDTILRSNPTNLKESIAVYKDLAGIALNSSNIVSFEAVPIGKYCTKKQVILNKLHDNNINNLEIALEQMVIIVVVSTAI